MVAKVRKQKVQKTTAFELHEVSGLLGLLVLVDSAGGVDRELRSEEMYEYVRLLEAMPRFSYYGVGRISDWSDGALLKDGRALICITTESFAGTFASHSDIRVYWVVITKNGIGRGRCLVT